MATFWICMDTTVFLLVVLLVKCLFTMPYYLCLMLIGQFESERCLFKLFGYYCIVKKTWNWSLVEG